MFGAGAVGPSHCCWVTCDVFGFLLFFVVVLHFGKNRCDAPGQRLLSELGIPQTHANGTELVMMEHSPLGGPAGVCTEGQLRGAGVGTRAEVLSL